MGVSKLTPATLKPDEGVIEKLESALKHAKAGRLREVIIIGSWTGGEYFHNASFKEGPLLIGYIEMAKWKIISDMERNENSPEPLD